MNDENLHQFVSILSEISYDSWNEIVKKDPEWQYLEKFYEAYGTGKFNVLLMMVGLNAYQLKGKAEQKYWLLLRKHIETYPVPDSLEELKQLLSDFYEKERLPKGKLKRLSTFLSSDLAETLWNSNPQEIELQFQTIWQKLSETMHQKANAKTICFTMKCLGISLYIQNRYNFNFSTIPIPVDSRIEQFTQKISNKKYDKMIEIQKFWQSVLFNIQDKKPFLTMIHLDSLIWQSGLLNTEELEEYFRECDSQKEGNNLIDFLTCI